MTYVRNNGMRSARFPLQGLHGPGCGCGGCAGVGSILAVAGLGCCTPVAGLGNTSKFDTPSTGTKPRPAATSSLPSLDGLTPLQTAQVTTLRVTHIPNVYRMRALLGPQPPEASFSDVMRLDLRRIAAAPFDVIRSVLLYALYQTGELVDKLPSVYRMANAGMPGAAALAARIVSLTSIGIRGTKEALDLVPTGTSGLGVSIVSAAALAAAALLAPVIVGGTPVLLIAVAAALVTFIRSSTDLDAQATRLCEQHFASTGVRCTPEDFAGYRAQLAEEDKGFIDGIGDEVAKATGLVVKYLLIGGAVLIGGVVLFNYLTYRAGKAVLKSPTGRKLVGAGVGAAIGGPAGARAGASLAENRRRRTSRRTRR